MFLRRLPKIGSLLGLLAILMATLAPAVSQALAGHDRLGQALNSVCSTDPAFIRAAETGTRPTHSIALHWQACDYCSLLAHTPLLSGSTAAFPGASSEFTLAVVVMRDDIRTREILTSAQPRAPPVLS